MKVKGRAGDRDHTLKETKKKEFESKQIKVMSSDGDKNEKRSQASEHEEKETRKGRKQQALTTLTQCALHAYKTIRERDCMFRQKCREETRDAETQEKQGDEQNSLDLATYIGNGACSPDDALDFLDLGKTISTIACTL